MFYCMNKSVFVWSCDPFNANNFASCEKVPSTDDTNYKRQPAYARNRPTLFVPGLVTQFEI